jgi:hypothetical protein
MCDDERNRLTIANRATLIAVVGAIAATIAAIAFNGSVFGALLGAASVAMAVAVTFILAAMAAVGLAIGYASDFDKCVASQPPCSGAFSNARNELIGIQALLLAQLYGSLLALGISWIPVVGVPGMVVVLIALFGIIALLIAFDYTWDSYLNCLNLI